MNKIEQALAELEDARMALVELAIELTLQHIARARKLLESANHDHKVVSDLTSWMED